MTNLVYKNKHFQVFKHADNTYAVGVTNNAQALISMAQVIGEASEVTRQNMQIFEFLSRYGVAITTTHPDFAHIQLGANAREPLLNIVKNARVI